MIEIIKEKPEKYIMICSHCDCKFSYDLKDLKTNYYCQTMILKLMTQNILMQVTQEHIY